MLDLGLRDKKKHLKAFHRHLLQNLTTYGVHKYYNKRLHCQSAECVSQSYPAKSNNLWMEYTSDYDKRLHCQSSECVSQSYPAKSNNLWSTQVLQQTFTLSIS